jgi:nitric oxide dioxygenase
MAEALSDKTIEIVKSTVPALEVGGTAITDRMYQLMFREASIYSRLAAAQGGWSGWRDFVIESTKPESEVVRSFILVPKDGRKVMRHQPGQYLTFALESPGKEPLRRNYSISSAPEDRAYRISVKREARPGVPPGVVSNWLHDQASPGTVLKVAPPAGEFFLKEKEDNPVVLLSGGVGLTPMISILEHVVRTGSGRPLWYIHGAENGRVHAMGAHVRELAAQTRNVTVRTFYNVPDPGDQAGRDYDERGLISGSWLARNTPVEEAVYYLCGPRPFLRAMVGSLARTGVALNRILYEFFGPADELVAA